jgi:hypothetical protein
MKLSHSALDKFKMCPEIYNLHYNKRIRPDFITSPLLFGVAVDEACNTMLLGNSNYKDVFDEKFSIMNINGHDVEMKFSDKIRYNKNDYDKRFLYDEDLKELSEMEFFTLEFSDTQGFFDFMEAMIPLNVHTLEEHMLYNYIMWMNLRRKAHVILDTYKKVVIPNIKRVIAVQKEILLENDGGDAFRGVIDFIGEWSDGVTYIFDNKTSGRPYKDDAVTLSSQLMAYSEETGINKAGFIVMCKAVPWEQHNNCDKCGFSDISSKKVCPKKCGPLNKIHVPKPVIQVILDDVSERNRDEMFTEIQYLADEIKSSVFTPDTSKCWKVYGQKCIYFDYCKNGSMNNLVKLEK